MRFNLRVHQVFMFCESLTFPSQQFVVLSLVFSLDPDQKEQLIEVIEKLLKDKSTVSKSSTVKYRPTTGGRRSQALLLSALHPTAHSMPWFVNTHLNPHIFRCSLLSVHLV